METRIQTRVLCFPDLAIGAGMNVRGSPLRRTLSPRGRERVLSSVVFPQAPHSCSEEATPRVAEWK